MKTLIIILLSALCPMLAATQGCLPEGITFDNQAKIDSFQVNYPGCTEIEGNVFIYNDIYNLNGLNVLTHIGGGLDIEVFPGDPLTSLNGLNNLTSIGGTLHFFIQFGLTSFSGLEGLNAIGGDFTVTVNDILTSFSGLDNLTSIGGNLSIGPEILGGTGPPSIEPNMCLTSLAGLNSLTSIGGNLSIFGNGALTSIEGLENLTQLGGDLGIGYDKYSGLFCGNSSLTSLTGLNSLTSIGGNLSISDNGALTSIEGLENLTQLGGDLGIGYGNYSELYGNSALTSLAGLENIEAGSIESLYIIGNTTLSDCAIQSICNYLSSPNGVVNIYGNATGCNNPPEVAGGCGITLQCLPYGTYNFFSQDEIDNFQSNYPGCTQLEGLVVISGNDIKNLFGLNGITYIGGTLSIYGNDSLTSLAGLDNLNMIGYSLEIGRIISWGITPCWIGNPVLADITGIENIDTSSINALYIVGNDSLSNCAVQTVCDYLAGPNVYIYIFDNAPGCNSIEEVDATCGVGVEESAVGGQRSAVVCYPNPTSGIVDFQWTMDDGRFVSLKIYNAQGLEVAVVLDERMAAGEHAVRLDMGALPAGIYCYRLTAASQVFSGKILLK